MRCSRRFDRSDGEGHAELRPPRLRNNADLALVVADQAAYNVEPEPCALSDWLSGKEGFKDAVADVCGYAGSIVRNAHHHFATLAAGRHFDVAGLGNGIER